MGNRRSKSDILYTEMMGDHEIPFYRLTTADGIIEEVPKHIRRIFSKRGNKINVAGWQVIYNRTGIPTFNPFFSDTKHGGPHLSLEKAINELRRFLSRTPNTKHSGLRLKEMKRDIYRTGIAGVRLDWRFGRRNALYDLKVEVRAGAYNPDRAKSFYVGTEFTVTTERLKAVLAKAKAFRDEQISIAAENGQTFTRLQPKSDIEMNAARAIEVLRHQKESHIDKLDDIAIEKADRWLNEKRLYMTFRNRKFYAQRKIINGVSVKVPEFVWREADEWQFEFELPDGSLHQDFLEASNDPHYDMCRIIADCFLESILTTQSPAHEEFQTEKRAG